MLDELEGALLIGVAACARAYHQALIAEGFTADEALTLTVAWQSSYLGAVRDADRIRRSDDPPPAPRR